MNYTADFFAQAKDVITKVFAEVRPELLAAFGTVDHTIKSDETVVTVLDQDIETRLREALSKFDSDIGLYGEEFGQLGNKETFWLIDPIDGTELFIRGIPHARNMVTLISDGEPQMALVYKFITDELYEAQKGKGSFCNGRALKVSDRELHRSWVMFADMLKDPDVQELLLAVRNRVNGVMITRDFTSVVNGQIDALVSYKSGGGEWDYAPRALLIKEAGGRVENIGGYGYDYKKLDMLAANPVIFDKLKEIIESA